MSQNHTYWILLKEVLKQHRATQESLLSGSLHANRLDNKLTNSTDYHPSFYFSSFLAERCSCDGGGSVRVDSTSYFHLIGKSRLGRVKFGTGTAEQKPGLAGAAARGPVCERLPGVQKESSRPQTRLRGRA